jgi:aquaporin Z
MVGQKSAGASLALHWREYLIEGWALGTFMISAGVATTLFEYPGFWLHQAIADAELRRALIGIAMGLTAVALIYSPWGQRSGAHMNPAVTLTFLRLGKIARWDAWFFIVAQCVGGILGVLLVRAVFADAFTQSPVSYIVTLPGPMGVEVAFVAEVLLSALLMAAVLWVSGSPRFERATGLCAGILVALFITFEAPLSGMSINPARTLASAVPAGIFDHLWVYCIAPPLGMLLAGEIYSRTRHRHEPCAKLHHSLDRSCIHCGYEPTVVRRALTNPT